MFFNWLGENLIECMFYEVFSCAVELTINYSSTTTSGQQKGNLLLHIMEKGWEAGQDGCVGPTERNNANLLLPPRGVTI